MVDFRTYPIVLGTSATVTLPEMAAAVITAVYEAEGATSYLAEELTPTTGAPTASEIQFTGTPAAPSDTVTLGVTPATAGGKLTVVYVPVGVLPANS